MSLLIYFIISITVGFFVFKQQEKNWWAQAHSYYERRDGEIIINHHNWFNWMERKATWIVILVALAWPVLVPSIILVYILNFFYNKIKHKFNINTTKTETDETITPEHEITNDDTISNPHHY